jgi:hypothetical protein
MEAIFQQRTRVPEISDAYVIGTVTVFSSWNNIDVRSLTPQESEVSKVDWWPIGDFIKAADGGREEFAFLGHRRMVSVFYNRYMDQNKTRQYQSPFNGDLIKSVYVQLHDGSVIEI